MSQSGSETAPDSSARGDQPASDGAAPSLPLRRLQTEAFLNFGRLHRALDACVGTLFTQQGLADITPAQAALLMVLFEARRPLTARELAEHQGLSQPTIGRFVRALLTQGWVSGVVDPA
ncbi:MAG: MarR family transcriptional regulator [Nannocystaceae bacterium]